MWLRHVETINKMDCQRKYISFHGCTRLKPLWPSIWIWSQNALNLYVILMQKHHEFVCVCVRKETSTAEGGLDSLLNCKTGHVGTDTIRMTNENWWQFAQRCQIARGTKKEEETKESKPESDEESSSSSSSSSSSTQYGAFTAGTTETARICAAVIDTVITVCYSMYCEDQNKSRWHRRQGHSSWWCQFLASLSASHRNQPEGTTQSLQSPDRPGSKRSFIKVTLDSRLKLGWSHEQGQVNLRLSRPQPCLQFLAPKLTSVLSFSICFTCFHVFRIAHV